MSVHFSFLDDDRFEEGTVSTNGFDDSHTLAVPGLDESACIAATCGDTRHFVPHAQHKPHLVEVENVLRAQFVLFNRFPELLPVLAGTFRKLSKTYLPFQNIPA